MTLKLFVAVYSGAISCFEILRDFVVRMMTRQNQNINETYRKQCTRVTGLHDSLARVLAFFL